MDLPGNLLQHFVVFRRGRQTLHDLPHFFTVEELPVHRIFQEPSPAGTGLGPRAEPLPEGEERHLQPFFGVPGTGPPEAPEKAFALRP